MEPEAISQAENAQADDREWELADEELDRTTTQRGPFCSTSRPCTCTRCMCR